MKYIKAPILKAKEQLDLMEGTLKLQRGQWVHIDKLQPIASRFVDASPSYVNIVHPRGAHCKGPFPQDAFLARVKVVKTSKPGRSILEKLKGSRRIIG